MAAAAPTGPPPPLTGTVVPNTPLERVSAAHEARLVQIAADISAMGNDPDIIMLGHSFIERWFSHTNDAQGGASLSIQHGISPYDVPNAGRRGNVLNAGSNGHQCNWSLYDMLPASMSGEGMFDALTTNPDRIGYVDLGTNDMWVAGETPEDTALGIAACVYFLITYGKCPRVVLHNVLPRTDFVSNEAEDCNAAVLAHPWIDYHVNTSGIITYADSDFAGFDPVTDTSDGLHPTELGYLEIADAAEVGFNAFLSEVDAAPAGTAASVASSAQNGATGNPASVSIASVAVSSADQGLTIVGVVRGNLSGTSFAATWGATDLGAPRVTNADGGLLSHFIWHLDDPGVATQTATITRTGGTITHLQIFTVVTNNVQGSGHGMVIARDDESFLGGVNPIHSGSLVLEVASNAGGGIPVVTSGQTSLQARSDSTTHTRVANSGPLADADIATTGWDTVDAPTSRTQVITYLELEKRAS